VCGFDEELPLESNQCEDHRSSGVLSTNKYSVFGILYLISIFYQFGIVFSLRHDIPVSLPESASTFSGGCFQLDATFFSQSVLIHFFSFLWYNEAKMMFAIAKAVMVEMITMLFRGFVFQWWLLVDPCP